MTTTCATKHAGASVFLGIFVVAVAVCGIGQRPVLAEHPSAGSQHARNTSREYSGISDEPRKITARRYNRRLEHRQSVLRYGNGLSTSKTQRAMFKAVQEHGHNDEVRRLLPEELPTVTSDDLTPQSPVFSVLRADGTLTVPPPALVSEAGTALAQARENFQNRLAETIADPCGEWVISQKQIDQLREALARWARYAERSSNWTGRKRASEYLTRLRVLIDQIEDTNRRGRIQHFLCQGGFGLPAGANLRQVLDFCRKNNLAVKPGSALQFHLAPLADALVRADRAEKLTVVEPPVARRSNRQSQRTSGVRPSISSQSRSSSRSDCRTASQSHTTYRWRTWMTSRPSYRTHVRYYTVPSSRTYTTRTIRIR